MTHSIHFIKSLEKISDDTWLYTPGEYTNDGVVTRYKMWIRFDQDQNICRVHTCQPTDDMEANVLTDSYGIYQACTDILKWFHHITDYENDPARLAELEDCYAKGFGPIPEFVIHPKYTDVWRAAERQRQNTPTGDS